MVTGLEYTRTLNLPSPAVDTLKLASQRNMAQPALSPQADNQYIPTVSSNLQTTLSEVIIDHPAKWAQTSGATQVSPGEMLTHRIMNSSIIVIFRC